jgi:hypothetical protein
MIGRLMAGLGTRTAKCAGAQGKIHQWETAAPFFQYFFGAGRDAGAGALATFDKLRFLQRPRRPKGGSPAVEIRGQKLRPADRTHHNWPYETPPSTIECAECAACPPLALTYVKHLKNVLLGVISGHRFEEALPQRPAEEN